MFVGKQQADMFRSKTVLNSVQTELTKLELNIAESNAHIDAFSKSATLAEKSIFLLEAIKPKFDFSIDGEAERDGSTLEVTFNLVNNGNFELSVVPTRFFLSRTPYRDNIKEVATENILTEPFDIKDVDTVRGLGAHEKRRHNFSVHLKKEHPSKVYYYMEYTVQTNIDVVQIVDQVAKQWGVTSSNNKSKNVVYRYGVIEFKNK